jgi:hypothetical protein
MMAREGFLARLGPREPWSRMEINNNPILHRDSLLQPLPLRGNGRQLAVRDLGILMPRYLLKMTIDVMNMRRCDGTLILPLASMSEWSAMMVTLIPKPSREPEPAYRATVRGDDLDTLAGTVRSIVGERTPYLDRLEI